MFPFDTDFCDDDLTVLAAYAAAEDAADAAKKAQAAQQNSVPHNVVDAGHGQCVSALQESRSDHADSGDSVTNDTTFGSTARTYTWIARLRQVEGVPLDRMAPIHGRLIAHGLLQFQLQGREAGVVYRLTTAGRKAITVAEAEAA